MKKIAALLLALTMVFAMAISVSALASPKPVEYFNINVTIDGTGNAMAQPYKIEKGSDDTVTLSVTDDGAGFVKWVISGDYTIVSGTLTSKTLVIKPESDISAEAVFADGKGAPKSGNDSNTSPKTGDMTAAVVLMMVLAMGAGVLCVKKIKE